MSIEDEGEEVITGTSIGGARKIRVYDPKGDFVIEVPEGAKVTFGYFNPAAPREQGPDRYGHEGNVARQTALRIYERGEKGNQLACFIGVRGFRDLSIGLTRFSRKLVVEQKFMDDGEGNREWGGNELRELVATTEDTYE